ncbi:DUF3761 domain-containing protein [Burkholderia pseudomultivorans]|uniref:DUF3761 domain-containing protein n=1 Tax=Burkholderia cenocepacia TaxID=95486 RepID=A0AAN0S0P5_9BURK|nr:DUF3761 domain-containing protein [Burkholderia pseudomultivorans]AIO37029.1 hypothetical protein DM39_4406 [Burkholderia cenocepacia]KVG64298.1 hypothetical protein WS80_18440 [Burkholderia pseudomultivorans]KWF08095.1 hypothetical protein WT55_00860 [Burkholderia pseudomultivorans]KWI50442.1 hypothetical protein WT72_25095 [Burkholderia pseudomultivorans]MBF5009212.1 DUF3761 domain-containing protein [Burkholderia pseudomultivorans]
MNKTMLIAALVAGMGMSIGAFAQVPASAPAGTTGLCKDGSFYSGASKKGACAGHKGVKTWYGASAAAGASAPAAMAPATAASAPAASGAAPAKSAPATTAAAGGGAGKVWVNDSTKVYHCSTDKYYGKTKHGSYMSEADAKAKGFHPSHGKACS